MKKIAHLALAAVALALLLAPMAAVADDYANKGSALQSQGSVTMSNDYIKVVVATEGTINMGTTGGDPAFSGDENKALLFGYPNPRRTSFASLRVIANGKTVDHRLGHTLLPSSGPTRSGDAIVTTWDAADVSVTQRITFYESPFSGRPDMALMRYTMRNTGSTSVQAGGAQHARRRGGHQRLGPVLCAGRRHTRQGARLCWWVIARLLYGVRVTNL